MFIVAWTDSLKSHHMPYTNQDIKADTAPFKAIHVWTTPGLLNEHWAAHPFQYVHSICAEPGSVDNLFGQDGLKKVILILCLKGGVAR